MRRLRQSWPLIAAGSLIVAIVALALVLAVAALDRRDRLVGDWRMESGTAVSIRQSGDDYVLRIGEDAAWIPASRLIGPRGDRVLVATVPADAMSMLTSDETQLAADVAIGPDEDGEMMIGTAGVLNVPARELGRLSRSKGALDWVALAALVASVVLLIGTIVIGRMVGLGTDDRLVPGLTLAVCVCVVLGMAGVWVALALVVPFVLLTWCAIVVWWLLPALPDVGGGLKAIFTAGGRRAFAEHVHRQDEQSDRGDALQAVVDDVLDERDG